MNAVSIARPFVSRRAAPRALSRNPATKIARPAKAELAALAVLLLIATATVQLGETYLGLLNLVVPTALLLILAVSLLMIVRRDLAALWMPLVWARLALISYYGAGSLVPLFGNSDTVDLLDSFYAAFPADAAKYNLMCVAFAFIVLVVSQVICWFIDNSEGRRNYLGWQPKKVGFDEKSLGLIFLVPAAAANFLYVKPHSFGLIEGTMPQLLAQMGLLTCVGYYILTGWALRERPVMVWPIFFLVAIEFIVGLLEFAKSTALLPAIVFTLAIIQHKTTVRKIAVGALTILVLYGAIAPVVTYSRTRLAEIYGSIAVASFDERWQILTSYTPERAEEVSNSRVQIAWARLSYVNAGTFAINQFDQGLPGNSLDQTFTALVPRFLYPDKPNITEVGRDFNIAVNGNATSLSSPGIPSELYWNAGWVGVLLGGIYVSFILTLLSLYAVKVVWVKAWYLLPIVLLGLRIGIRMDGFLVPDFIGPLPLLVIAHLLLTFLNSLTLKKK